VREKGKGGGGAFSSYPLWRVREKSKRSKSSGAWERKRIQFFFCICEEKKKRKAAFARLSVGEGGKEQDTPLFLGGERENPIAYPQKKKRFFSTFRFTRRGGRNRISEEGRGKKSLRP